MSKSFFSVVLSIVLIQFYPCCLYSVIIIEEPVKWSPNNPPNQPIDYVEVRDGGILTIAAGMDIRFENQKSIIIWAGGKLLVRGTRNNRVILRGNVNERGYWGGIKVWRDSGADDFALADLEFCDIRNTGYVGGTRAAIFSDCGKVLLYECTISNGYYGIKMYDYWDNTATTSSRNNGSEWFEFNADRFAGDDNIRGVEKTKIYDMEAEGIYFYRSWMHASPHHCEDCTGRKLVRQCEIYDCSNGIRLAPAMGANPPFSPSEATAGVMHESWAETNPHNAAVVHPVEISNCYIHDNDGNGLLVEVDGKDWGNNFAGFQLHPEDGLFHAWNNIITYNGSDGACINLEGDSPVINLEFANPTFMHNLLWGNNGKGLLIRCHRISYDPYQAGEYWYVRFPENQLQAYNLIYNNIFGPNVDDCLSIESVNGGLEGGQYQHYIERNAFKKSDGQEFISIPQGVNVNTDDNRFHHITPWYIINENNPSSPSNFKTSFPNTDIICPLINFGLIHNDGGDIAPLSELANDVANVTDATFPPYWNNNQRTSPDVGPFGGTLSRHFWAFNSWGPCGDYRYMFYADYIFVTDQSVNLNNKVAGEYYYYPRIGNGPRPIKGKLRYDSPPPEDQGTTAIFLDYQYDAVIEDSLELIGNAGMEIIFMPLDEEEENYLGPWDGITFNSEDALNTELNFVTIIGAVDGISLTGVKPTSGSSRVLFNNMVIDNCGLGIYANDSRVAITNTTITNSVGSTSSAGIHLVNCAAGQVLIDNCSISGSGEYQSYNNAGIYLYNSDPEIINCTIEDNYGSGISCVGSSPDMDTYDYIEVEPRPNSIHANGEGTQSGSHGAEIYLDANSTPVIAYNNIWDWDTSPIGFAIYNCASSMISAEHNWWGTDDPDSYKYSLFYSPTYVDFDPWEDYEITTSSLDLFTRGMRLWDRGLFSDAAAIFRETLSDTGTVGINSAHYLVGCANQMRDGDLDDARDRLLDAADGHDDGRVARVANRWAMHCLTMHGRYADAIREYDGVRRNPGNLRDSVLAVMDILAVEELANLNRGDAAEDVRGRMDLLQKMLQDIDAQGNSIAAPEECSLGPVYPNPFNDEAVIAYYLPQAGRVKLAIYDISGREAAVLSDGWSSAGRKTELMNLSAYPAGMYFVRLSAGNRLLVQKALLLR